MTEKQQVHVVAFIGLGSNLDEPVKQIMAARLAITQINNVREVAFSSLYRSPPMGPQDQPDYVNAVMEIETSLPAIELLRCLQMIEQQQRRVRKKERWVARTLDLDLLLYGRQQIDMPDLIVPHVGIGTRAFVLYPLMEIAPELEIPGLGHMENLVANCPRDGLKQI